jgi:hypothetical protein
VLIRAYLRHPRSFLVIPGLTQFSLRPRLIELLVPFDREYHILPEWRVASFINFVETQAVFCG